MIEDLITRLEDEAAAEASQKEWCDKEMSETIAARDAAQREIEAKNALLYVGIDLWLINPND